MREIKFRAWDEDDEFVYFEMNEGYKPFTRISEILHRLGDWQQFTGLKDKNDIDIYEGDIIAFEGNYCIEEYIGNQKAIIKWNDYECCYYFDVINKDTLEVVCHKDNSLEVIGNIYKNPELIKGDD